MAKQEVFSNVGQALLAPEKSIKCAISITGHKAVGLPIPHKEREG